MQAKSFLFGGLCCISHVRMELDQFPHFTDDKNQWDIVAIWKKKYLR